MASIASSAKLSQCSEHKDETATLYCMQCESLACALCISGSHKSHVVVEVDKAGEQKRAKRDREVIEAVIDEEADRLIQAVTRRRQELKQRLESLTDTQDPSTSQRDLVPSRLVSELDSPEVLDVIARWGQVNCLPMVQGVVFAEEPAGRLGWSRMEGAQEYEVQMAKLGVVTEEKNEGGVLDDGFRRVYLGRKEQHDLSFPDGGAFAIRVRARFEEGWGPFSDVVKHTAEMPLIQNVAFVQDNGLPSSNNSERVTWSAVPNAQQYEVQKAGPMEDAKDEGKSSFSQLYQGSETSCSARLFDNYGWYLVRVRVQRDGAWSSFSAPFVFRHGSGLVWDAKNKPKEMRLKSDKNDLNRTVRHQAKRWEWFSALSSVPLSDICSPAGLAVFQVRVDSCRDSMSIGVSPSLPPPGTCVGAKDYGFAFYNGTDMCRDGEFISECGEDYGERDVIQVKVDFHAKTLRFLTNGVPQGPLFENVDLSKPLYACVSLHSSCTQVSFV